MPTSAAVARLDDLGERDARCTAHCHAALLSNRSQILFLPSFDGALLCGIARRDKKCSSYRFAAHLVTGSKVRRAVRAHGTRSANDRVFERYMIQSSFVWLCAVRERQGVHHPLARACPGPGPSQAALPHSPALLLGDGASQCSHCCTRQYSSMCHCCSLYTMASCAAGLRDRPSDMAGRSVPIVTSSSARSSGGGARATGGGADGGVDASGSNIALIVCLCLSPFFLFLLICCCCQALRGIEGCARKPCMVNRCSP